MSNLFNQAGGFLDVKGPNKIVRNKQQVYNVNKRNKLESDEVVEVMDLYTKEMNADTKVIRVIGLASKVSVFVSSEQQLLDV